MCLFTDTFRLYLAFFELRSPTENMYEPQKYIKLWKPFYNFLLKFDLVCFPLLHLFAFAFIKVEQSTI